ncbi:PEP-CTERM sorting domain-containing protein [Paucibacter sp. XJ19-41]|uniref:PEP-CTERM sorting domain-containing protein n=1 Tax=Paucibacter sp. XJ19-41 TaxID=2927824 RepID=UPI00234A7C2F|nr:PEP-CTERM sorting domain-containing protein [Paucibacter sp. XJ19-41]MDC6170146.1 PEP-CTERM sorting domain-containing protein [Paucibacter sp. XJ19-41]
MDMKLRPFNLSHKAKLLALCGGLMTAGLAGAAIDPGHPDWIPDGDAANPRFGFPELTLFIWDPVAKAIYSKDLGTKAKPYLEGQDQTGNFFTYAQQDAGYQKFFDPININNDAAFKAFTEVSTNSDNQQWGVIATSVTGFGIEPNEMYAFSTLRHLSAAGVTNPEWSLLKGTKNQGFSDAVSNYINTVVEPLNRGAGAGGSFSNPYNSHAVAGLDSKLNFDYAVNGSSVDFEGTEAYWGNLSGGIGGGKLADAANFLNPVSTTNPQTGTKSYHSSWFYYLTSTSDQASAPILVDEFDNAGHDGYWGLAINGNGEYILSFTMEAAVTQVSTVLGMQRRARTDFAAGVGGIRFITAPLGEFAGWTPGGFVPGNAVSAVPEPSSWLMLGLGLAALGWRARRNSR